MDKSTSEAQPGCMEYGIIIALLVIIVPALLVAKKLGWISDEQFDKLQQKYKPETPGQS